MMEEIYFDYISAHPLDPRVRQTMADYVEQSWPNPSSQHKLGDRTSEAMEKARGYVAGLIQAKPEEIVFTSGGTEAINHAIKGVAWALQEKGDHIVTSNIEHNAVLRSLRRLKMMGYKVTSVPVDKFGLVDPGDVKKALTDKTVLVSIMHANSEIGTIEPIAEIGKIAKDRGVLFHTDAVASAGIEPIDVEGMGVDLVSLSANQFYGPSGVGALYIRQGTSLWPLLDGGVQEGDRRAGTENVLGIVGMGEAARIGKEEMGIRREHALKLKRLLRTKIENTIEEVYFNGHPTLSLANLLSVCFEYVEGESMMIMLGDAGICVSTRSACAAGALQASHVLLAIGRDFVTAQGALVFSFGAFNTDEEVEKVTEELKSTVNMLRNISALTRKRKKEHSIGKQPTAALASIVNGKPIMPGKG
jgi:cysteine desulfurase